MAECKGPLHSVQVHAPLPFVRTTAVTPAMGITIINVCIPASEPSWFT